MHGNRGGLCFAPARRELRIIGLRIKEQDKDKGTKSCHNMQPLVILYSHLISCNNIEQKGLKGHKVAAVYAVLNSGYKRGSGDGWEFAEHISITKDLASDINYFLNLKGADT
eukprot:scaffold72890_cov28-Cyclotella_meneghiniana.AAC.1